MQTSLRIKHGENVCVLEIEDNPALVNTRFWTFDTPTAKSTDFSQICINGETPEIGLSYFIVIAH